MPRPSIEKWIRVISPQMRSLSIVVSTVRWKAIRSVSAWNQRRVSARVSNNNTATSRVTSHSRANWFKSWTFWSSFLEFEIKKECIIKLFNSSIRWRSFSIGSFCLFWDLINHVNKIESFVRLVFFSLESIQHIVFVAFLWWLLLGCEIICGFYV